MKSHRSVGDRTVHGPQHAGHRACRCAGIDVMHVPYRGAAPAIRNLLAGQVQLVVLDVSVLLLHIRGRRRAR